MACVSRFTMINFVLVYLIVALATDESVKGNLPQ